MRWGSGTPRMGRTARESLKRKLLYVGVLGMLLVGTGLGLGWAFLRGLA